MEEKIVNKPNWTAIIIGIVVIGIMLGGISLIKNEEQTNPQQPHNQFVPVSLDTPPFGLSLPDGIIEDSDDFEEGMLAKAPSSWEGQAYRIDSDELAAILIFYDSIEGWGTGEYSTHEMYGYVYHTLTFDDAPNLLVVCIAYSDQISYLALTGYVE